MPGRNAPQPALTRDVALRLCAEVRHEREAKWYRILPGQCWGCIKASSGVPEKMCMYDGETYGGCSLVNERYAERLESR